MKLFTRRFTEAQALDWSRQRAKGRWKWIMLYGVLGFGVTISILITLLQTLIYQDGFHLKDEPSKILIRSIVWIFAGAIYGMIQWNISEKAYQRYTEQQEK